MDLSQYVYKESDCYYFDPENYSEENRQSLQIDYEDGDTIKWSFENKRFIGILREIGVNLKLFKIINVKELT